MTKQEAIENHRKLWNWIADKTEKEQRVVYKWEYFSHHGILDEIPNDCYCCLYNNERNPYRGCYCCPLVWQHPLNLKCIEYERYILFNTWQERAKWASVIADLPEAETYFMYDHAPVTLTQLDEKLSPEQIMRMMDDGILVYLRREQKGR